MSGKKVYREPPVFTQSEIVAELESGDPHRIAEALASAVRNADDWQWTQDRCIELLKAGEVEIRWAAATGLGDLAFFFRRPIDHIRVLTALYEAAQDPAIADPAGFSISLIRQRFPSR